METFIQLTINGIMLGALYAAMTLGFSVIWGVMRLINLAHGEFVLIGAYTAWLLSHPARTDVGIKIAGQTLPLLNFVFILLWASLGLVLSRFALRNWITSPALRRLLGYGASGLIVYVVRALWVAAGSPAVDPPLSVPLVKPVAFRI